MTDVTLRYLLLGEDKNATAAIEGVGSTAESVSDTIGASFTKMGSLIGGEVGAVMAGIGDGLGSISEAAQGMAPKLAAGGIAVAGIGVALSTLGSKTREAENALKQAFGAAGESIEEYEDRINDVVRANQNLAVSDSDTRQALATMILVTNDAAGSLEHMGLVTNLAAAKHISLEAAAKMVAAAMNGNTKLFKQYGLSVDSTSAAQSKLVKAQDAAEIATNSQREAVKHLRDVQRDVASGAISGAQAQTALKQAHKEVEKASDALKTKQDKVKAAVIAVKEAADEQAAGFENLSNKLDGTAEASVDSFTGKLQVLKVKAGDVLAQFGNEWGPVIQTAGATMAIFGSILTFASSIALGTRIQLGLLAIQTAAVSAATKVAAAAQWILNAAMAANPIGLIVIAIIALVAAFVLAWRHSQTFRRIVTGAFDAVMQAGASAFNWIKDHWKLILAILTGPIGIAVLLITSNWGKIKSGFSNTIDGIRNIWSGFMGFLRGIPGRVSAVTSGMWNGIKSGFKSILNGIIDLWNSLHFSIPEVKVFGKTLGGGEIGMPNIPHLARGGVLTSAGSVIVGDGGNGSGAEILDLPVGARVRPLSDADRGAGGGDLGTLTLIHKTPSGEEIERTLIQFQRDQGGRPLAVVTR